MMMWSSWWRNIRKISKMISFVSSNPLIYRFSVTNYFAFVRYVSCSILFHNLCQKSKIFERQLKNGTVFVRKLALCRWRHQNKKTSINSNPNFSVKRSIYANVCAKYYSSLSLSLFSDMRNIRCKLIFTAHFAIAIIILQSWKWKGNTR